MRGAPICQKVRLVKFRGIVIRTYVLVKRKKWQVAGLAGGAFLSPSLFNPVRGFSLYKGKEPGNELFGLIFVPGNELFDAL